MNSPFTFSRKQGYLVGFLSICQRSFNRMLGTNKLSGFVARKLPGINGMEYKEAIRDRRYADEWVFRCRGEAGNENIRDYFTGNEWRYFLGQSGLQWIDTY